MPTADADRIHTHVRDHYGAAARTAATATATGGCCSTPAVPAECSGAFGAQQYHAEQLADLPGAVATASLGCGNPTMLIQLEPGQTVLDLGSGGGIDVLLSARRVGPTGHVYGLDMTPEMIELAERNIAEAGVGNATILHGMLEDIPLPEASVDVVISNCVINLTPDKGKALAEAFRVLRPGGHFAVSDVVLTRPLPPAAERLLGLWAGCVAGALTEARYRELLERAGFVDIEIVPTHVHDRAAMEAIARGMDLSSIADPDALLDDVDGAVMNAFVRARRP